MDLSKVFGGASDRHLEVLRDDLSEIYYDAASNVRRIVFGEESQYGSFIGAYLGVLTLPTARGWTARW